MTVSLGALAESFGQRGVELARAGSRLEALELLTTGSDGWPHSAWLSPGEVLPIDELQFAVALWPSSTTTANLLRDGRALAEFVHAGVLVKVRLRACPVGSIGVGEKKLAGFLCEVEDVSPDAVGYASVKSGPVYELEDVSSVTQRWAQQLHALGEVVGVVKHAAKGGVEGRPA